MAGRRLFHVELLEDRTIYQVKLRKNSNNVFRIFLLSAETLEFLPNVDQKAMD